MSASHLTQSDPRPLGSLAMQHSPAGWNEDEPLDAIVYDVHPALIPHGEYPYAAEYPYGPHAPGSPSNRSKSEIEPLTAVLHQLLEAVAALIAVINRPPDFVVPKTFGMSAILGIMTAVALLFGGLRWLDAWPVFYLFFGMQMLAICLVQMFYGQTPRLASVLAGAIILPLFAMIAAMFDGRAHPIAIIAMVVIFVPCGAILGYLTGTCAAGIFLVMDYLEPYLQGQRLAGGTHSSSAAPAP